MHQRIAHPPVSPDSATSGPASIIDSLSDTLLNAFTKVRKPDERFLEVRDNLDKFEESLVAIERTEARARTRIGGERAFRPPFTGLQYEPYNCFDIEIAKTGID